MFQIILFLVLFSTVVILLVSISAAKGIFDEVKRVKKDNEETNLLLEKIQKEYENKNKVVYLTVKHIKTIIEGKNIPDLNKFQEELDKI